MTDRKVTAPSQHNDVTIVEGYRTGLIGQIVALHASTYSEWAGFGATFEGKVASELAAFIDRLDHADNAVWHAVDNDRIVGSIAIDGEGLGEHRAHLRWFIVAPSCQGSGLGKALLSRALTFVEQRPFQETHLWTLKGLDAARALYERTGFLLAEEYRGDQWGSPITEQTFVRKHRASG